MIRPLDQHLDGDEIDALISSSASGVLGAGQLSEQAMGDARRHVDSCRDCEQKVAGHRSVQSAISRSGEPSNVGPGQDCRPEIEWLQVAAGLLPQAEAMERMKHAAQCAHCGPLLKAVADALNDEATSEEEQLLSSLDNANPEWQNCMAQALQTTAAPPRESRQKAPWFGGLFSWPRLIFAVPALAVVVIAAWLGVRALRPPSANLLLAQAYTERRAFEPRVPDAKYAPVRVERGEAGSSFDKPAALLKAEALIGENLRKTPNDPTWLEAKGRADLLDGHFDAAIRTIQRALESQPDSPQLLTDLGTAYYLRGKSSDRPIDYGNAIEALGKAISKTPDDPIALFNRALACEEMFLYTQAVDDWQHYLKVDSQSDWSSEARQHLTALQDKIKQHNQSEAEPLLTPEEIVNLETRHPAQLEHLDDKIERYIEASTRLWLTAVSDGGSAKDEASEASGYLAHVLAKNHEDEWLSEFHRTLASDAHNPAFHELVASADEFRTGRFGKSGELARQALRDFKRTNNRPGVLRAQLALMLGQALSLDFSGCLNTASQALPMLNGLNYHWLTAAILVEQGQCLGGAAQLSAAMASNEAGLQLARKYHFPDMLLRAWAFKAQYLEDIAGSTRAIAEIVPALRNFWQFHSSNSVGENLYSVLSDLVNTRQWAYVEAFTFSELLSQFPSTNRLDQSLEMQFLAEAQERAGEFSSSQQTLHKTAALLSELPDDSAVALRRSEILLDSAQVQIQLGQPREAEEALQPFRDKLEHSSAGQFQAEYLRVLGEAYLALGDMQDANHVFDRALAVSETGLNNLHREADKLSWSRLQGQIYRDLLQLKLRSETPLDAFAWWEWYRESSVRSSTDNALQAPEPEPLSWNANRMHDEQAHTARISYALLKHSMVIFVMRHGVVHVHELPLPENLELLARNFVAQCADSSSDVRTLNDESFRLYRILIAPIESEIEGAPELQIETDGSLDKVPYPLLRRQGGVLIGDRFLVTFPEGIPYSRRDSVTIFPNRILSGSTAVIVAAAGLRALTPLPDAEQEANDVARRFEHARLMLGGQVKAADVLRNLRDAEVFHFTGHAIADERRVGLVLNSDELLTAHDFARTRFPNLKLAVLSACDTANGEEGSVADVNSVARTLIAGGVAYVIASRWPVDSAVTHQMMNAFYSNLLSGKTPSESLRAATLAIRGLPQYQHPYYWGSFSIFQRS